MVCKCFYDILAYSVIHILSSHDIWIHMKHDTWYTTHTHIQPYHLFVNIFLVFCCWTNPGEFQVHLKVHPEVISRKLLSLHVIRALTWQRSWIWHHQHPTRCRWTLDWKDGFFNFGNTKSWFDGNDSEKNIYTLHMYVYIYICMYIYIS